MNEPQFPLGGFVAIDDFEGEIAKTPANPHLMASWRLAPGKRRRSPLMRSNGGWACNGYVREGGGGEVLGVGGLSWDR